jgi:hypothetical protein
MEIFLFKKNSAPGFDSRYPLDIIKISGYPEIFIIRCRAGSGSRTRLISLES